MNKDLSLDDFKKWIKEQSGSANEDHKNGILGTEVQPNINLYKLMSKIDLDEGIVKNVCSDFVENGGIIVGIDNKQFLIEVSSGRFYLHKNFVDEV